MKREAVVEFFDEVDHGPRTFKDDVLGVLSRWAELFEAKNASYGDSIGDPVRIFAKGETQTALVRARIDDKLSRIAKGDMTLENLKDTLDDLGVYVAILRALEDK